MGEVKLQEDLNICGKRALATDVDQEELTVEQQQHRTPEQPRPSHSQRNRWLQEIWPLSSPSFDKKRPTLSRSLCSPRARTAAMHLQHLAAPSAALAPLLCQGMEAALETNPTKLENLTKGRSMGDDAAKDEKKKPFVAYCSNVTLFGAKC